MESDIESQDHLNKQLTAAVKLGETANVRALLAAGADPRTGDSEALSIAATRGYTEIVAVLLEDRRADPAASNSAALCMASGWGHTRIVRQLLKDGRADPAANNSLALIFAVKGGHVGVVRALLEDRRADPAAFGSDALRVASEVGHTEIVRELLKDGRANPAVDESKPLRLAVGGGHIDVVRALLEEGRADPAASDNAALRMAVTYGDREIVRELLKDGRADPVAVSHNFGLAWPARSGHVDSVCLILAAMPASARMHVLNDLTAGIPPWVRPHAATFLLASRHDPAMSRMLDIIQVLLKSEIPARSLIALAYEAERRNMSPEAVLDLQQRGEISKILRNRLGPTAEMPPTAAVAQQNDLTSLAGVSKAEPMLHMGAGQLDLAQHPGILEALAPELPAYITTAIWQTLRAQARGEERPRAYGTPAQRVRDRVASTVLLDAAVKAYNAFVGDVKNVANHKDPLLSAAANHCLRALNSLSDAMTHADASGVARAQAHVETKMQTYEARVNKVLGEVDQKRARGFELVRSIVRMPAQQLAEFARAQARERTSHKAPQIAL